MRIAIVTQDEPFYLPAFLERIAQARGKDVVAMIILKPFDEKLLDTVRRAYNLYGPWEFLIYGFRFVWLKAMNVVSRFLPLGGPWSAADVARRHGIPVYRPENINVPAFLAVLSQEIQPDIIVSVAASQIFKKDILALPRYGCINVHTAPLPRYRGMLPTFWVLLNGEKETAVTVHYMTERLDDGDIIRQEPVPILADDTLDSLIRRTKRFGAEALLQALEDIEQGKVVCKPNDASQATYFSFPTRKDAQRFRALGRRFR
jgi:methionyl-tRNA formyltransferase